MDGWLAVARRRPSPGLHFYSLALASGVSQESRLGLDVDDVNRTNERRGGSSPLKFPRKNSNPKIPNRRDLNDHPRDDALHQAIKVVKIDRVLLQNLSKNMIYV